MADDAGALLVRSGLVSSSALDEARVRSAEAGGTVGEALVASGAVADDRLTEFYRQRLLVPQVNPNSLARLPAKVVALIPSEMAVELRAIPVSIDGDNNLTVAMSDPSDRHAVDEIAFFTGTYVVRAVATQMQIAWCLAHYYGHVTDLGQRLLEETVGPARAKSITEQVRDARTRRFERGEVKVDPAELERRVTQPQVTVSDDYPTPVDTPKLKARSREASGEIRAPSNRAPSIRPPLPDESAEIIIVAQPPSTESIAESIASPGFAGTRSIPEGSAESIASPGFAGTRSIPEGSAESIDSGPVMTIEVPPPESGPVVVETSVRLDSGPVITVEITEEAIERNVGDVTAKSRPAPRLPAAPAPPPEPPPPVKPMPVRKRPAAPDPPELAARAGEVQLATGDSIRKIDFDVPSIMISDEIERALHQGSQVSGEVSGRHHNVPERGVRGDLDDNSTVVVREPITNEASEPVLLDRHRPSDPPTTVRSAAPNVEIDDGPSDVVVLETKKRPSVRRLPQHTQVGIGVVPALTRKRPSLPPDEAQLGENDPTRLNTFAAPPGDYSSASDELLAAPPAPYQNQDTEPVATTQPGPSQHPGPSGQIRLDRVQPAPHRADDDDDDDEYALKSKPTIVMSAIELDEVVPGHRTVPVPGHLDSEDGWGPPGTTIPPPFLGAMPGATSETSGVIPIPDVDTAPLLIAAPRPPNAVAGTRATEGAMARVLEESTARVLELIHTLDHTSDRDQVLACLIAHLAESHKRAGFFAVRGGELTLFAVLPRLPKIHSAALRLDFPSTLQDVVGTRLPYRGPMHDEASRTFVQNTLGTSPPELLLVPIAVRERVVGVLFGAHRVKHTFDDQLALAARAAGMALERILKAKRG